MQLAEDCYRATCDFPREEIYGTTAQVRRSAASIPANLAEGYGRDQTGAFIQFLRVAQGWTRELETRLILSRGIGRLPADAELGLLDRCEAISNRLRSLIRSREGGA